jgi:hypothetical protein
MNCTDEFAGCITSMNPFSSAMASSRDLFRFAKQRWAITNRAPERRRSPGKSNRNRESYRLQGDSKQRSELRARSSSLTARGKARLSSTYRV